MGSTRALDFCIVGLGARTPAGLRGPTSAIAIHAGITRIAEHPYMVDRAGDPLMVGMDSTLAEHAWLERMVQLSRSAVAESVEGLPVDPRVPLPVYLALPEVDLFFNEHDASDVCRRLAMELDGVVSIQPVPVTEGHAAGVLALERALAGLRGGMFGCAVVCGVDTFLDPDRLDALDRDKRLIVADSRWGFTPGEGAAALAVCTGTFARNHGLKVLAWIAGLGNSLEPNSMHREGVCTGEGLAAALRAAAAQAGAQVTKQYCDINGERYREHEMSYAILRVPKAAFVDAVDYIAPASAWGHMGAASIPLMMTLPIVTHARGFSPGPWPMVWSGSENGRRGAVVLHLPS